MGSIMCMGVATANSILIVSFATERLAEHANAVAAAIEAGFHALSPRADDRPRHDHRHDSHGAWPGRSGEQNAPLGRAVIGGLLLATMATLMFVPAVFGLFHGRRGAAQSGHP